MPPSTVMKRTIRFNLNGLYRRIRIEETNISLQDLEKIFLKLFHKTGHATFHYADPEDGAMITIMADDELHLALDDYHHLKLKVDLINCPYQHHQNREASADNSSAATITGEMDVEIVPHVRQPPPFIDFSREAETSIDNIDRPPVELATPINGTSKSLTSTTDSDTSSDSDSDDSTSSPPRKLRSRTTFTSSICRESPRAGPSRTSARHRILSPSPPSLQQVPITGQKGSKNNYHRKLCLPPSEDLPFPHCPDTHNARNSRMVSIHKCGVFLQIPRVSVTFANGITDTIHARTAMELDPSSGYIFRMYLRNRRPAEVRWLKKFNYLQEYREENLNMTSQSDGTGEDDDNDRNSINNNTYQSAI